jgi:hypothetical protein
MNRTLSITYKSVALARVVCIAAALVLSKMYSDSLPHTGLFADGINIKFDWWVMPVVIVALCLFGVAVLCQLLLAFSPQLREAMLPRRAIMWSLFVLEILLTTFLFINTINQVQDAFFAPPRTIIDSLLSPLFPVNESTRVIEKYQAVNQSLMALCSLFFVLFLWKYRNR